MSFIWMSNIPSISLHITMVFHKMGISKPRFQINHLRKAILKSYIVWIPRSFIGLSKPKTPPSYGFNHYHKNLKWGASSRWSFCPNSAWSSIETTTIGKTHPTVELKIVGIRPIYDKNSLDKQWENLLWKKCLSESRIKSLFIRHLWISLGSVRTTFDGVANTRF